MIEIIKELKIKIFQNIQILKKDLSGYLLHQVQNLYPN